MAGSYDDGAAGFLGENTKTYCRGRGSLGAEVNLDFIGGDDLSRGGGKVLGGKPVIIANNDSSFCKPGLIKMVGYGLGTDLNVVEGKVPGDYAAPAIGAKLNGAINLSHPL